MLNVFNPKKSRNLLVYLNPGFTSRHGHYVSQSNNIMVGCLAGDYALLHLGNVDVPQECVRPFNINAFFNFRPHIVKYRNEIPLRLARHELRVKLNFLKEWMLERRNDYDRVVLYLYGGHPEYTVFFSPFLKEIKDAGLKSIFVNNLLYHNLDDSGNLLEAFRPIYRNAKRLAQQLGNVVHVTDTELARERINQLIPDMLTYLPVPALFEKNIYYPMVRWKQVSWKTRKRMLEGAGPKIKVCYMGYPNEKWGYNDVYELYLKCKSEGVLEQVHFTVRHQTLHSNLEHQKIFEMWRHESESIMHYEGFIDSAVYWGLLNHSDVVIVPYSPKHYPIETSGVYIESASSGKIVLCSKGTWFDFKNKEYDSGLAYEHGDVDDMFAKLSHIVNSFDREKTRALSASERFSVDFSIESISKQVFSYECK